MEGAVLRVRLFGDVRVEFDGTPVRVTTRPLCAVLLAMLVTRPGTRFARRALAAELWPDEGDSTRANANLRRHLFALQSSLPPLAPGETWIESDATSLAWSSRRRVWCDATAFEDALNDPAAPAEAFVDKGEFMRGYGSDWVVGARESYRARAIARLLALTVQYQDDDRMTDALACCAAVLDMDPLCEEAVDLTIGLHGELGDATAASQVFAAFAERLRRELDSQPAPATFASLERVRALAASRRERLPRAMTSFVGRGSEVEAVAATLERQRCVTIVGAGGLGKTRLSLELSRTIAPRFVDGSFFIDLSTLANGRPIVDAVVRALELPSEIARDGIAGINRFFRNRRALLILDNCEHVRDACATFVSELLAAAPRVTVLATSRVALGLRAEVIYRLMALTAPEARALFFERSRRPDVESPAWTAAEGACIDRICTMLDRNPLAIELGAGLCASMAPADIERHLPDRFAMLQSSDPSLPERHRTFEATIAWSYELLADAERRLFENLAVFPGSFTFDAAVTIGGESSAALRGLVEKSMLHRDERRSDRYRMLFSLGDFARRRFALSPDAPAVRERHAVHFATIVLFAENPETPEFFAGEHDWLATMDAELDNVRAALRFMLGAEAGPKLRAHGVRAARAAERYFSMRGYFVEGMAWIEEARTHTTPGTHDEALVRYKIGRFQLRVGRQAEALATLLDVADFFRSTGAETELAFALADAGAAAFHVPDLAATGALFDEALAIAERLDLGGAKAAVLGNAGVLAAATGDAERANACFREAARLFKSQGDRRFLARMLDSLACSDIMAGRFAAAIDLLNEGIAIARDLRAVPLLADMLMNVGNALAADGRPAEARERFTEALALVFPLGMARETGHALLGFASLAADRGEAVTAARLTGAAAGFIARDVQTHLPNSLYGRTRAAAVARIGEAEFERERARGELLETEDAVDLAMSATAADDPTASGVATASSAVAR